MRVLAASCVFLLLHYVALAQQIQGIDHTNPHTVRNTKRHDRITVSSSSVLPNWTLVQQNRLSGWTNDHFEHLETGTTSYIWVSLSLNGDTGEKRILSYDMYGRLLHKQSFSFSHTFQTFILYEEILISYSDTTSDTQKTKFVLFGANNILDTSEYDRTIDTLLTDGKLAKSAYKRISYASGTPNVYETNYSKFSYLHNPYREIEVRKYNTTFGSGSSTIVRRTTTYLGTLSTSMYIYNKREYLSGSQWRLDQTDSGVQIQPNHFIYYISHSPGVISYKTEYKLDFRLPTNDDVYDSQYCRQIYLLKEYAYSHDSSGQLSHPYHGIYISDSLVFDANNKLTIRANYGAFATTDTNNNIVSREIKYIQLQTAPFTTTSPIKHRPQLAMAPNHTNNSILVYGLPQGQQQVRLTDAQGRTIYTELRDDRILVPPGLAFGIYALRVLDAKGESWASRIVW